MKTVFDCVIIGSGPICMMEALFGKRSGQSVLMIEKEDILGGVWGSRTLFEIDDIEQFCHILTLNTQGYRALEHFSPIGYASLPMSRNLFGSRMKSQNWITSMIFAPLPVFCEIEIYIIGGISAWFGWALI
jgi:hypothetical protein